MKLCTFSYVYWPSGYHLLWSVCWNCLLIFLLRYHCCSFYFYYIFLFSYYIFYSPVTSFILFILFLFLYFFQLPAYFYLTLSQTSVCYPVSDLRSLVSKNLFFKNFIKFHTYSAILIKIYFCFQVFPKIICLFFGILTIIFSSFCCRMIS